jgi:hypothetical protein
VVFRPALDVANTATSRGSLRQVYRVSETNESSAALTVNQKASLCEEMRKSLRTCGLLRLQQVPDGLVEQVAMARAVSAVSGQ